MGLLRVVVSAILILSAITFCALFGSLPRFRKTPIGYANRLIWIKIPKSFVTLDGWITGGRSTVWMKRTGNYLMKENHPIVLIFYVGLLVIGELLFVPRIWYFLSGSQQSLVLLLVTLPYAFTYLTVASTASIITKDNHDDQMRRYPYDHVLFYPGAFCSTCQHLKPARSKHCRVCNVCVAKMDHHCPWVMTCLGRDNYRWFLLMLLSLGAALAYGAHLGYSVLYHYLQERFDRENPTLLQPWTRGLTFSQKLNVFGWSFMWDPRIGACAMLAAFTAPLVWGLFLYHVYLVWAGVTTNEGFKWDDWREDVRDGYVFRARRQSRHDRSGGGDDDGGGDPVGPEGGYGYIEQRDDHYDEHEPRVRWPRRRGDFILINRAIPASRDRFPPNMALREPEWSRVESMRDIDNIYDLGFVRNVKEVLNL